MSLHAATRILPIRIGPGATIPRYQGIPTIHGQWEEAYREEISWRSASLHVAISGRGRFPPIRFSGNNAKPFQFDKRTKFILS